MMFSTRKKVNIDLLTPVLNKYIIQANKDSVKVLKSYNLRGQIMKRLFIKEEKDAIIIYDGWNSFLKSTSIENLEVDLLKIFSGEFSEIIAN